MNNLNIPDQLLVSSAQQYPDRIAVEETEGGSITYRELNELFDRLRGRLVHLGVCPGDRAIDQRKRCADQG